MTDEIYRALEKEFIAQGCSIQKIAAVSPMFFSVAPYLESFLGYGRGKMAHYTLFDCAPLAEITPEEITAGSPRLKLLVGEAILALQSEETRVSQQKRKALVARLERDQMVWL